MTPAMFATWGFGLLLAGTPGLVDWRMGWMWAKLALVAALSAFHFALSRWRDAFSADRNKHSTQFYRILNELPTLAMIAVVLLVVVKPF
jgi:putative membrane protein